LGVAQKQAIAIGQTREALDRDCFVFDV
jgi:hypothetical protein